MSNKRTMTVDLTDGQLKGISIGEEITVTVKGKVKEASASTPPEKEGKKIVWEGMPANMRVEMTSVTIDGDNEFESMAEDK